jgi:hypothetical protein
VRHAAGDEQGVSGAAHAAIRSHLKRQLPLEDAERLVEGVMVQRRSGPAGLHEILDDADRPTCLVGGERDSGSDQRNGHLALPVVSDH